MIPIPFSITININISRVNDEKKDKEPLFVTPKSTGKHRCRWRGLWPRGGRKQ
jgi:hypothetical protein